MAIIRSANDPYTLVRSFDLNQEVQWSADQSKANFQGLALSIPLRAIDGDSVTMTMELQKKQTGSVTPAFDLSLSGDQQIRAPINIVLPSLVSSGYLLSEDLPLLVKFTSLETGQSRFLPTSHFATLPNGIVVSVNEWGTLSLERQSEFGELTFTSPKENAYINAANLADFTVAGTCSLEGAAIRFSITLNGTAKPSNLNTTAPVICTNARWSSELDFNQFTDGSVLLHANLTAESGQTAETQTLRLIKDSTAPSVVIGTTSSSPTNTSPINFTLTFSEPVNALSINHLTLTNAVASQLNGAGATYTIQAYPIENGPVSMTLTGSHVTDVAGNPNTPGHAVTVIFNSAAPTATITSSTSYNTKNSPIPLIITFSDDVQGFTESDIQPTNGHISGFSGSGSIYTALLAPATNGSVTVDIPAHAASNAEGTPSLAAATFSRIYDTTAPTVSISSQTTSPTNQTSIPVVITFSEPVTGFNNTDVTTTNGTLANFTGSDTNFSFTVTPAGSGLVTIQINQDSAQDSAGNGNALGIPLSISFDPDSPSVSISSPEPASYLNLATAAFMLVQGTCSENGRTVTVSVTDGTTTLAPPTQPTCQTESSTQFQTTIDATALTDGPLTLVARHVDAAGNETISSGIVIIKDTSAPAAPTSLTWQSASPTTQLQLTASWVVSTSADVSTQSVQFYAGPNCDQSIGDSISKSSTAATQELLADTEGQFTYKVSVTDDAGHITVSGCSAPLIVATTAVAAQSTISAVSPVIANGTDQSTVSIVLKNIHGHPVVGITPTFSATDTGFTNVYSPCTPTDHVGVSNCFLKSTKAEVKTVSIESPVTQVGTNITFKHGPADRLHFVLLDASPTFNSPMTPQPQLVLYDAHGNMVTSGPDASAAVEITMVSGTGEISGTKIVQSSQGIADFSGASLKFSSPGPKSIRAIKLNTIAQGGTPAVGVDSQTIVVSDAPPVLTNITDRLYPGDPLTQGTALSIDVQNETSQSDDDMTYTCSFDQLIDGSVTAGTSCLSLPGLATFNQSAGQLSWTPGTAVFGSYEIKVTGSDAIGSDDELFAVTVRAPYINNHLMSHWDAAFADQKHPAIPGATTWPNLINTSPDGTFSETNNLSWSGQGTPAAPHSLSFNGSGTINFGQIGSALTKIMVSGWMKSSGIRDAVLLTNNDNANGNGFTLRESPKYSDLVMSLNPAAYWRLNETSGTTASDATGNHHATIQSGVSLGAAGGLVNESNSGMSFPGNENTAYLSVANGYTNLIKGRSIHTIELWVRPASFSVSPVLIGAAGVNYFLQIGPNVAYWGTSSTYRTYTTKMIPGLWYHIVAAKDGPGNSGRLYINGVLQTTFSGSLPDEPSVDKDLLIGRYTATGNWAYNGIIDEVAIYHSALSATDIARLYRAGQTGKKAEFVIGRSYRDIVTQDQPISYWRLGETTGPATSDLMGANPGNAVNSPTFGQTGAILGDNDNAMTFASSSSQYVIAGPNGIPSGGQARSFEAWVRYASGNGVIVGINTTTGQKYYVQDGKPFLFTDGINQANNLTVVEADSPPANVWSHVVFTLDGANRWKYYLNGTMRRNGTFAINVNTGPTTSISIGQRLDGYNGFFNGSIDDVSVYGFELSAAQVQNHYNAGRAQYGGLCSLTSALTQETWNFLTGVFDGSSASVFVNGRNRCTVTNLPAVVGSPPNNLTAGATTTGQKSWLGQLSELFIYGGSEESTIGTTSDQKDNFDYTADRYRTTPINDIPRSGLILHLDPANAQEGLRSYPNGCTSTSTGWFDLSSSNLTGALTNFTGCGEQSGWSGDGGTSTTGITGPYRISFDGVDDFVKADLSASSLNALTISLWLNARSGNSSTGAFQWAGGLSYGLPLALLQLTSSNQLRFYVDQNYRFTTTLDPLIWYHIILLYDGSTWKAYKNGALIDSWSGSMANQSLASAVYLGNGFNGYFKGSIGPVLIYNRALTPEEINKTCRTQAVRFSSVDCQ